MNWLIYCVMVCLTAICATVKFEYECGLEAVDSTPLVRGGLGVKAKQFPWHVAIFHREKENQFEQICGGSLVRSNLVISAAHCFSDLSHSHQVRVADYRIVAGVRFSSWNSQEIGRQQSEVREIRLGEEYGASIRNFEDDISIIYLTTSFTFSDTVRTVCLDLADMELNTNQTSSGTVGKVAGWGLTESGAPSDSLNFLALPVVAREECLDKLPYRYKSYFTSDKICAGLTNGTAVCEGDSGGGLVFPLQNTSAGPQRWFLRGVLSNAPSSRNLSDPCLANVFALYTNIYKHRIWLTTQMDENLPREGCIVKGGTGVCRKFSECLTARNQAALGILPQYCSPSNKICCVESMDTCPPLPPSAVSQRKTGSKAHDYCVDLLESLYPCQLNGSSWIRGDLCEPNPEDHNPQYRVERLTKASGSEKQHFGFVFDGSRIPVYLIRERWLLTRASYWDYVLGKSAYDITPPPEVVFSLSRTVRHPQYNTGAVGTNDIVLVEIDRPVPFSTRYRPVCLHTAQDSLGVGGLTLSRRGLWGIRSGRYYQYRPGVRPPFRIETLLENGFRPDLNSQNAATLLSQDECRRKFPPGSKGAPGGVTDSHLCVTSSNGGELCGDSWNYITASNVSGGCTQLLVGLLLESKYERSCTELYLRVSSYIPWVESVVWP